MHVFIYIRRELQNDSNHEKSDKNFLLFCVSSPLQTREYAWKNGLFLCACRLCTIRTWWRWWWSSAATTLCIHVRVYKSFLLLLRHSILEIICFFASYDGFFVYIFHCCLCVLARFHIIFFSTIYVTQCRVT